MSGSAVANSGRGTAWRRGIVTAMALFALALTAPALAAAPMNEHVILLHGMCRSSSSMHAMERARLPIERMLEISARPAN